MPASPRRVITPCSMRPLGRPRRRGVEEPDGRDIVSCSERWPSRGPGARASQKARRRPRGAGVGDGLKVYMLLVTLRTPPAPPSNGVVMVVPVMQTGTPHDQYLSGRLDPCQPPRAPPNV